jgi:uncharacterized DUF497 family protein
LLESDLIRTIPRRVTSASSSPAAAINPAFCWYPFVALGEVVRIISARPLTRSERKLYEEEKFP